MPPAKSLSHRALVAAVGAAIMTAGAFGMHAAVPPVAAWLACHTGAEVVEGVALLPRLERVTALALTVVACNVGMVLCAWVVLRHVHATCRPHGVPFVFVVGLGCYAWVPRLDGEGSGWMLMASTSMPVVAALAGLLEASLRRLPRRELGTAALLLTATLAHQVTWWGLWSS